MPSCASQTWQCNQIWQLQWPGAVSVSGTRRPRMPCCCLCSHCPGSRLCACRQWSRRLGLHRSGITRHVLKNRTARTSELLSSDASKPDVFDSNTARVGAQRQQNAFNIKIANGWMCAYASSTWDYLSACALNRLMGAPSYRPWGSWNWPVLLAASWQGMAPTRLPAWQIRPLVWTLHWAA